MITEVRKKISLSWLQLIVYGLAVIPGLWLIWDGLNANLTINPIQALTQRTGKYALFFLLLSLACTPITTILGTKEVTKVRRPLGLTAFLYASTHFFLFIGIDYAFNPRLLSEAILEKPYALVGLAAFLILTVLAITSFRWWMKNLGKVWKRIHRFVYLAGVLVVIHYFWVAKGDFFRLSGDILLPLLSAIILAMLFALRLPPVRKWFSKRNRKLPWSGRKEQKDPGINKPVEYVDQI